MVPSPAVTPTSYQPVPDTLPPGYSAVPTGNDLPPGYSLVPQHPAAPPKPTTVSEAAVQATQPPKQPPKMMNLEEASRAYEEGAAGGPNILGKPVPSWAMPLVEAFGFGRKLVPTSDVSEALVPTPSPTIGDVLFQVLPPFLAGGVTGEAGSEVAGVERAAQESAATEASLGVPKPQYGSVAVASMQGAKKALEETPVPHARQVARDTAEALGFKKERYYVIHRDPKTPDIQSAPVWFDEEHRAFAWIQRQVAHGEDPSHYTIEKESEHPLGRLAPPAPEQPFAPLPLPTETQQIQSMFGEAPEEMTPAPHQMSLGPQFLTQPSLEADPVAKATTAAHVYTSLAQDLTRVEATGAPLRPFAALEHINEDHLMTVLDTDVQAVENSLALENLIKDMKKARTDEAGRLQMDIMDEARQTVAQAILTGKSGFRDTLSSAARLFATGANNVIRGMGETGKILAQKGDDYYYDFTSWAGYVDHAFLKALQAFDKKDAVDAMQRIRIVREWNRIPEDYRKSLGGLPQLSEKEQQLKAIVDAIYDTNVKAKVAEVERLRNLPPGTVVPQWEPDYWAWRLDRTKVGEEQSTSYLQAVRDFAGHLIKQSPTLKYNQALTLAAQIFDDTNRPFANLEKERTVRFLPYEFRKSAIQEFREYIYGAYRRLSHIKNFGYFGEDVEKLIKKLETEGQDANFATRWYREITGSRMDPYREESRALIGRLQSAQIATKGTFISLRHSTQAVFNAPLVAEGHFLPVIKGLLKFFKNRAEVEDFAARAGNIFHPVVQQLEDIATTRSDVGGMGRAVLKFQRLYSVMKANMEISSAIADEWLKDLYTAKKVSTLKRIFPDPKDVERVLASATREEIPIDLRTRAAHWFAGKVMFPAKPGALPIEWNDPWVSLAMLFKGFHFKQTTTLWDSVVTNGIKKGNIKPLLIIATIAPFYGELIKDVRAFMVHPGTALQDWQEGKPFPEILRDITNGNTLVTTVPNFINKGEWKPLLKTYLYDLGYASALGFFDTVLQILQTGGSEALKMKILASNMMGPTFSSILNIGGASRNFVQTLGETIKQNMPGYEAGPKDMPADWRFLLGTLKPIAAEVPFLSPTLQQWMQSPEETRRALIKQALDAYIRGDWKKYNDTVNQLTSFMSWYKEQYQNFPAIRREHMGITPQEIHDAIQRAQQQGITPP